MKWRIAHKLTIASVLMILLTMLVGGVGLWQVLVISRAVADCVAQALEAARLFEQTQARAQREQLVGQITTHITAAASVREVLRAGSEELGRALGVPRSVVRLRPQGIPTQASEEVQS